MKSLRGLRSNHHGFQLSTLTRVGAQTAHLIALVVLAAVSGDAFAQSNRFWNGSVNNNWRLDDNWDNGNRPTANHFVWLQQGVGQNDIDLATGTGDDIDRDVFSIRFMTNGNSTTIPDFFGPMQDLEASWHLRRGRIRIADNANFPNSNRFVGWVDTRTGPNTVTVVADIDVVSSAIVFFTALGENTYAGNAGSTDSIEGMIHYGDLSGSAFVRLTGGGTGTSSAPFRSALILADANSFSGKMEVDASADLFLQDDQAMEFASVQVLSGGNLFVMASDVVMDELINYSSIPLSNRNITFGSRDTLNTSGTFTGTGSIRYVGAHTWTMSGANTFSGELQAAGTAPVTVAGESIWPNALVVAESTNGFTFTSTSTTIGGLSGSASLNIPGELILGSNAFDATYSGDLTGVGPIRQDNSQDWTYNGFSDIPFTIQSGLLSGGGDMAATMVSSTGTLSPGTSALAGSYGTQRFDSLDLDGTLQVDVNSAVGFFDEVFVDGSLDLSGASLQVRADMAPPQPFIIATYGSLTGTFSSVTGLPPKVDLRYAWDNGIGSTDNIALVPNVVPDAVNDGYTVLEDGVLSGVNVLGNDVDGDLDPLTVMTAGTFTAAGIGGTVSLNANGDFTYTPPGDAFGMASFSYTVEDNNGDQDTATVTITITSVNDIPAFSAANPAAVDEDAGSQSIAGWATFDPGAVNESGQSVQAYLVSNVSNPALFAAGPSVDTAGNLTYTPANNASGTSSFDVQAQDDGGTANGGEDTTSAQSFTITINPINDAPSFTATSPSAVLEDAGLQSLSAWAVFNPGAPNESAQAPLAYTISNVSNSALFAVAPAVDASGTLTYTPADDVFGTATFDVSVQDDGGTANGGVDTSSVQSFSVTVTSVNDEPTFTAMDPAPVDEDSGTSTVMSWASFSPGSANESGQTVQGYYVDAVSNPGLFTVGPSVDASGNLTYTLASDASGTSTFDVQVQDNGGTASGGDDLSPAQTFTITVSEINDAPTFAALNPPTVAEDAGEQTVSNWSTFDPGASDESGQAVNTYLVSNVNNPDLFSSGPNIDTAGNLTYTPATDANGAATFEVTVQDDGGTANGGVDTSDAQSFTITVSPVNDEPSFTASNPPPVVEDSGAQTVNSWASFDPGPANENGQSVQGYIVSNVSDASLFFIGPAIDETGTLSYTLAENANGMATFDVVVQDDGGTASGGENTSSAATFTISAQPVNDPPTFVDGGDIELFEDGVYAAAWATSISPGPNNESGQTVSFSVMVDNPSLFQTLPTIDELGVLSFLPAPDTVGTSTITVELIDDGGTVNGGDAVSDPVVVIVDVIAAADLSINKTSDSTFIQSGSVLTYTIRVENPGPSDVVNARVVDPLTPQLSSATWTCIAEMGASCMASGTGPLDEMVELPEGGAVEYVLVTTVIDASGGQITNIAEVQTPGSVVEINAGDNTDSATNFSALFADGFETTD